MRPASVREHCQPEDDKALACQRATIFVFKPKTMAIACLLIQGSGHRTAKPECGDILRAVDSQLNVHLGGEYGGRGETYPKVLVVF